MQESTSISSSFAREAAEQLRDGNTRRALDLCLAGTKVFPNYAMGYFILGKCFDAFDRTAEALAAYRHALGKLPDNPTLLALIRRGEEKQQKEIHAAAENQQAEGFQAKKSEVPTDRQHSEQHLQAKEESAFDVLARRLQDVKRIKPDPSVTSEATTIPLGNERSQRFVTVTVADIYAEQGEYAEAINAYKALMIQHPEEREKYSKRLVELEHLRALQHKEKNQEPPSNRKAS
jgi:tetratricopeptide (TPR) repeat protein